MRYIPILPDWIMLKFADQAYFGILFSKNSQNQININLLLDRQV